MNIDHIFLTIAVATVLVPFGWVMWQMTRYCIELSKNED